MKQTPEAIAFFKGVKTNFYYKNLAGITYLKKCLTGQKIYFSGLPNNTKGIIKIMCNRKYFIVKIEKNLNFITLWVYKNDDVYLLFIDINKQNLSYIDSDFIKNIEIIEQFYKIANKQNYYLLGI